MSTSDLIAKVWETLDWPKALQLAVILIVTGVAAALVLTALVLAGRTMTGVRQPGRSALPSLPQ
jgi:hypothetical protein